MIFWNMKYLFIIISSCYCDVRAVSLQFKLLCRRIDTQYKQHLQKDCQFYRRVYQRTGTRRYFIENCKKITAFCHNYQRIYRWNSTRRYFTENYKKITAFCHNYRWIGTRRYFTESCKKLRYFATITDAPAIITDVYTDVFTDGWHTFQSAHLSEVADERGKTNVRVLWRTISDGFADELWKIWRDFWNFWCENQLNTDRI